MRSAGKKQLASSISHYLKPPEAKILVAQSESELDSSTRVSVNRGLTQTEVSVSLPALNKERWGQQAVSTAIPGDTSSLTYVSIQGCKHNTESTPGAPGVD